MDLPCDITGNPYLLTAMNSVTPQPQLKMGSANKTSSFKIFLFCSKGSLGPSLQPRLDAQTNFDTRHRNLLVEVYDDDGDLEKAIKYDAVFDKDKKIVARKMTLKDSSGQFLTAAEVKRRHPDCQIEELDPKYAESFSLKRADAYVDDVNNSDITYNPMTDNCQEFVNQLLRFVTGYNGPVATIGDQLKSRVREFFVAIALPIVYVTVSILLFSVMLTCLSFAVVHFELPPGPIWFEDILNEVLWGYTTSWFCEKIHYGLWFYLIPTMIQVASIPCSLCAIFASLFLITRFYSLEAADLMEHWSGVTIFESCLFGYLLPFCLCLYKKLCEKALNSVPPGVTALVLMVFGIILQLLDEGPDPYATLNRFGFYRFCAQAAQTVAEDLGRILNRMI